MQLQMQFMYFVRNLVWIHCRKYLQKKDIARKERRIEFAFEEQRFYDVRRWKIGPETQTTLHGVRFVSPTEFKVTKTDIRTWNDRLYLTPVPHDEIVRSSVLKQNPGY